MVNATIMRAMELLRGSWAGQLGVLGVGGVALGMLTQGMAAGVSPLQYALVAATLLLLGAGAARIAAMQYGEFNRELIIDELDTMAPMAPRLLVQAAVAGAPAVASIVIAFLGAAIHPLLGLVLVPVVFVALAMSVAPVMLAVVGVLHGEPGWLPAAAAGSLRSAPRQLVAASIVGMGGAGLLALPVIVPALVFSTLGGVLGSFGTGVVFSSIAPGWGCVALALWQTSGQQLSSAGGSSPAEQVASSEDVPVSQMHWHEGGRWDVALEPAAAWGTWIQLAAPCAVAFRLTWSGDASPQIALATEDGAWSDPGGIGVSGGSVVTSLAAGNTYLQIVARGVAAQAIGVELLVGQPADGAASAA